MASSAKHQRSRRGGRVAIGDITSSAHLLTGPGAPKNEEQKE